MEIKDLEQSMREKMAEEFLTSLSSEVKEEILRSAVEKRIKEIASSYEIRSIIDSRLKDDAAVYLEEYLKDEDVQERLKAKAREALDLLLDSVVKSIAKELERNMKSKYSNFIESKEE